MYQQIGKKKTEQHVIIMCAHKHKHKYKHKSHLLCHQQQEQDERDGKKQHTESK